MTISLVTFDALHTLITPRLPIYVQYSQIFEPYLGVLDPNALKRSFKTALKQLQMEKPVYESGAREWWGEIIKRTAIGAGADPHVVDKSLGQIVPRLMHRFSSREGYKLFDDSLTCLRELKKMNVRTGLVSNTDKRMRSVLNDLDVTRYLDPLLLSEEVGVEKPSREIYLMACARAGVKGEEVVHIGDELEADYFGAKDSGLFALLVRRPGPEGEGESKEASEDLSKVEVVPGFQEVVEWVRQHNQFSG